MHKHFDKLKILAVIAAIALALIMIYSGMRLVEVYNQGTGNHGVVTSKTIVRNGVEYYPRQDITVFLFMGIDEFGPMESSGAPQNPGASDVVILGIFDETAGCIDVLALNRDTMLEMPVLGVGGKPAGSYYGQLALAHTFGDGLEESCENTKKAVSDFLYGLRIDYYLAANMDAIQILNDAVGGVKVNVVHDFSKVDPSIPMGETVLMGEQALSFIRMRKDVDDQLNVTRMERQNHYMERFTETLRGKVDQSDSFILDLYEQIEDYSVSDCSATSFNAIMRHFADYPLRDIITLEGENRRGEKYMEFYPDEQKLDELILRLFYAGK